MPPPLTPGYRYGPSITYPDTYYTWFTSDYSWFGSMTYGPLGSHTHFPTDDHSYNIEADGAARDGWRDDSVGDISYTPGPYGTGGSDSRLGREYGYDSHYLFPYQYSQGHFIWQAPVWAACISFYGGNSTPDLGYYGAGGVRQQIWGTLVSQPYIYPTQIGWYADTAEIEILGARVTCTNTKGTAFFASRAESGGPLTLNGLGYLEQNPGAAPGGAISLGGAGVHDVPDSLLTDVNTETDLLNVEFSVALPPDTDPGATNYAPLDPYSDEFPPVEVDERGEATLSLKVKFHLPVLYPILYSAVVPPLRQKQRDDSLGFTSGAPRLNTVGKGSPTSQQETRAPRLPQGGQSYL